MLTYLLIKIHTHFILYIYCTSNAACLWVCDPPWLGQITKERCGIDTNSKFLLFAHVFASQHPRDIRQFSSLARIGGESRQVVSGSGTECLCLKKIYILVYSSPALLIGMLENSFSKGNLATKRWKRRCMIRASRIYIKCNWDKQSACCT